MAFRLSAKNCVVKNEKWIIFPLHNFEQLHTIFGTSAPY